MVYVIKWVLGANQVLDTFLVDHSGSLDYLPNHDNAILILSRSFSGGDSEVVGLAYQDTLCDVIGSGGLFIHLYSGNRYLFSLLKSVLLRNLKNVIYLSQKATSERFVGAQ